MYLTIGCSVVVDGRSSHPEGSLSASHVPVEHAQVRLRMMQVEVARGRITLGVREVARHEGVVTVRCRRSRKKRNLNEVLMHDTISY